MEEGKLGTSGPFGHDNVDVTRNVRLLPNVETFFNLFERVADFYNLPDTTRILMLQCTLTGRAQEASECTLASCASIFVHKESSIKSIQTCARGL